MKLWQKFAVALTTATLLYGAQLRMWTDTRNRFLERWDRTDALSLLAGIVGIALVFTFLREALRRQHFLRRGVDHIFVLVLGTGVISTFLTYPDYKTELLFLGLVAITTASWFRPQWRVPQRTAVVALIFSPVVLILGNQILRYPSWTRATEVREFTHAPQSSEAGPIFVFIFDEWSYKRSTENNHLLPLFKNLGAFAKQAWTFDFAQSAGPRTDVSLPRFLWQRTDDLKIGEGDTYWPQNGTFIPTTKVESLFGTAKANGYNTVLRGFYLPYQQMLGEQLDSCTSYNLLPKANAFAHKLRSNGLRNLTFQHDPVSRKLSKVFGIGTFLLSHESNSVHWEQLNRDLKRDVLDLTEKADGKTFAFIHFPLPHGPFIFNADGSYTGPQKDPHRSYDIKGYQRHLSYLDVVIGQILDVIRKKGIFDTATIILTSDHSWRSDSTIEGKLSDNEIVRHVPLFIKLPSQREPGRVTSKFELTNLRPLLQAVMSRRLDEAHSILTSLNDKPASGLALSPGASQ